MSQRPYKRQRNRKGPACGLDDWNCTDHSAVEEGGRWRGTSPEAPSFASSKQQRLPAESAEQVQQRERLSDWERGDPPAAFQSFRLPQKHVADALMIWDVCQVRATLVTYMRADRLWGGHFLRHQCAATMLTCHHKVLQRGSDSLRRTQVTRQMVRLSMLSPSPPLQAA